MRWGRGVLLLRQLLQLLLRLEIVSSHVLASGINGYALVDNDQSKSSESVFECWTYLLHQLQRHLVSSDQHRQVHPIYFASLDQHLALLLQQRVSWYFEADGDSDGSQCLCSLDIPMTKPF
jgi:hypothetical protein